MENNEMTEREMLEFAAKAIGITLKPMEVKNVEFMGDDRFIGFMTDPSQWERGWFDPLTDDGDALRLAVKLGLIVCVMLDAGFTGVYIGSDSPCGKYDIVEMHGDNEIVATRLAITKAAAEIGKRMA